MLLRDHGLMRYHRVPNSPPSWLSTGGLEEKLRIGEIGILKAIELSSFLPPNRCFLSIDCDRSSYMGCLLFDDLAFCRYISKLLRRCRNRSIAEMGGLDL